MGWGMEHAAHRIARLTVELEGWRISAGLISDELSTAHATIARLTAELEDANADAARLAEALRGCQVPADWPLAWPDGMTEGAPWVDDALAQHDARDKGTLDKGH
jgi:hypothetical protein